MSWRRNAFSYLLWVFYTIMVGTFMVGIGNIFCGEGMPAYGGALFAAVFMAAVGGAAFLLHRFAPGLKAFFFRKKRLCLTMEAVSLTLLFLLGAAFRAAGFREMEENAIYYGLAEVTIGQDILPIDHGAVHAYVRMLHLIFIFLGNHYVLGIVVQIFFQCIAAMLLYYLIRKYVGLLAALTAAGFLACAPYMVQEGLTLSPAMLYLCLLAAAGVLITAACGKFEPFLLIFAGIVSSVTAYLDVAGVALLMFTVGMVLCADRKLSGKSRKAVSCLCCVLGFVCGFAGCVAMASLAGGKGFGGVLQGWFRLYAHEAFLVPAAVGIGDSRVESLVLIGLMAFGVYSFWMEEKKGRFAVSMSVTCAVIIADCFGIFTSEMPGTLYLYLLFVILAGIGIQQCFGCKEELKVQAAQGGDEEQAAVSVETAVDNRKAEKEQEAGENSEIQADWGRQEVKESFENNSDTAADKKTEKLTEEKTEEKTDTTAKKEIHYLENPLPLPKKHEKKVLDYDYPVADDDDFDI